MDRVWKIDEKHRMGSPIRLILQFAFEPILVL